MFLNARWAAGHSHFVSQIGENISSLDTMKTKSEFKIALTGASGFIGATVAPFLIEQGYTVTALCRSESSAARVRALGAQAQVLDLFDPASLAAVLRGSHAVLHMAARLEFFGDYSLFHRDNVTLTETLLQAAKAAGVQRFVYVSAAAVVVGSRSKQPFTEAAVLADNPAGAYGRTKLLAERAVLAAQSPNFQTIALRPPFVWGEAAPAFDSIAQATHKGQFVWINGGRYSVATIHVRNLAAAIDAALRAPAATGAYFVTDGERILFRELIGAALRSRGQQPPRLSLPRWMVMLSAQFMAVLWRVLQLRGAPPITPIIVDLIGAELALDDSRARTELGYRNAVKASQELAVL